MDCHPCILYHKHLEMCSAKEELLRHHKQSSEVDVSGRKVVILHYYCTLSFPLFDINRKLFLSRFLSLTTVLNCESAVFIYRKLPPTCHFEFAFPVKPLPVRLYKTVLISELLFFSLYFRLHLYTSASSRHFFFFH